MSSAAMQTASQPAPAQTSSPYASPSPSRHHYQDRTPTGSQHQNYSPRTSNVTPNHYSPSNNHPSVNGTPVSSTLSPAQGAYVTSAPAMSSSAQNAVQSSPYEARVSPGSGPSPGNARHRSNNVPDHVASVSIPPRTSSNQRSRQSASQSTERTAAPRPERERTDEMDYRRDRDRSAHSRDRAGEASSSSNNAGTRRRGQRSPEMAEIRNQSSRSTTQAPVEPPTTSAPSAELSKEPSTVLNDVLISDPAIDVERENARQLEAQPISATGILPVTGLGLVDNEGVDEGARSGTRSRHDYSNDPPRRKETTFGSYVLGQTIGSGEFGKVKLGWKKDGSIQVAIKLIRRESLGSNPSRLPKIYREISILRDLSHPNIVRLHEMVETDRHIGIIMEYASGGELFDYILNQRYLKDNAARRLFAQLVSGVGYLHKKGIVHRDLKLENLLLDRNRNIIITDFGFANTFNANDELGEEIEYNLTNREFVKRMRLDKTDANGMRRGDLMQTSCGSPCYAAPELVVSDSLYTGRKVDVWSCGVILYAMLAGYLPFDDDPANPEGDNINLLYKYIVTTPLTFPEYVTPHARDLLRRILVPDPRKRADLFEVARHSWLSEYSHIVSHITSTTTNVAEIATTTVPAEGVPEAPTLARSASVREPPKSHQSSVATLGGLTHHQGKIAPEDQSDKSKTPRETKRRTVQVEYVEPKSQTTRGDGSQASASNSAASPGLSSKARAGSQGRGPADPSLTASQAKPLPSDPPVDVGSRAAYSTANPPRSMSESAGAMVGTQATRPNTGHSAHSFSGGRLPSRGSYGQPVAPTVAATTAQGRLQQPGNGRQYGFSAGAQDSGVASIGLPSTQQMPANSNDSFSQEPPKGHKRSSTVSSIGEKLFGRTGSIFGSRGSQSTASRPRTGKRYPPTSMKEPFVQDESRTSIDSRRSSSYGFGRKQGDSGSETRSRRFSLIPPLRAFSSRTDSSERSPRLPQDQEFGPSSTARSEPRPTTGPAVASTPPTMGYAREPAQHGPGLQSQDTNYPAQIDRQFATLHGPEQTPQANSYNGQAHQNESYPQYINNYAPNPDEGFNGDYEDQPRPSMQGSRLKAGVLQKPHRKFADAYEYERDSSYHAGSSGAARKVMDFFRRRGRARTGEV